MPNQTDNKRETIEVNTENVKLQTVKTFRMRVEEMEGTPFFLFVSLVIFLMRM